MVGKWLMAGWDSLLCGRRSLHAGRSGIKIHVDETREGGGELSG
jgi:hypothetical protein